MNSSLLLVSITNVLLSLLLHYTPSVAQTDDCPDSLTTTEFIDYVKTFPACRETSSISLLRHYAPILDGVYDDLDQFVGQIDYDEVEAFCSKVANCKNALSSCQGQLYDVIDTAGKALCQNGNAMTADLVSAVSTLSKNTCDLTKFDDITTTHDGCYLGRDEAQSQTYVLDLARAKRIDSAQERCNLRFIESQGICSAEGAKAYGTILAASQDLEKIDMTYDSFSFYNQDIEGRRKSMKLFGLTHLSYDGSAATTCTALPASGLLLWNTRVRITGSFESLKPMSSFHILNQITVQFYGADGVIIDSYSAMLTDSELSYKTLRQQGDLASDVEAKKIDENQVLLTYSDIATTVSIGHYGNSLAVVVFMPSSLLEDETVGLLVDGCQLYSGTVLSANSVEFGVTSDCTTECNSVEVYNPQCAIDCSNELTQYMELYNSLESLTAAASEFSDVSSSTSQTSSFLVLIVSVIAHLYITYH